MYRSCKCPVEQSACRCSSNESQSSWDDVCPGEPYNDQCSCCPCEKPMVKGKFGLAYVIKTPKQKCCKPLGWQVEFEDTPSRIVNNCERMMKWVNCPPLGDCNNIETNFCAYPEDCGKLLKERRNNPPKCCCNSKPPKRDKDVRTCCTREPKKRSKNQTCYSQNPEPVCIICENCKVNTQGCCNPAKVLCCSKTCRKPPCKCQDQNDARCKCCMKGEALEKYCCKCLGPKLNTFFRESLDKKYCDQYQHNQCCCIKQFCICDDLLDYIPKRDEKPQTNAYKIEYKPVSKENKETKTEDKELGVVKSPVRETNKKEPIKGLAKPAQSTNLIDELEERLKERKEKENEVVAPKNIKHEGSNKKNTTEVKTEQERKVIPKAPSKDEASDKKEGDNTNNKEEKKNNEEEEKTSEEGKENIPKALPKNDSIDTQPPKNVGNEESIRNENTKVPTAVDSSVPTSKSEEEKKSILKAPSKVETPQGVDKEQVEVPNNSSLGSGVRSIQSVRSKNISNHPSILERIKEAQKRQLNEIRSPKTPSIKDNKSNMETGKITSNSPTRLDAPKAEEEIRKIDYENADRSVIEKIREAHHKQMHEIHPDE